MGLSRIPEGKKVIAVIGGQWGDEGKGKVVDVLAENADVVFRANGGPNAGHTTRVGDVRLALHLIPSGIRFDGNGTTNVIGRGVVFDPRVFKREVTELLAKGLTVNNLRVDGLAQIIFPFHILLDCLAEAKAGLAKIGTTKRGVGPTYENETGRRGVTLLDMYSQDEFARKVTRALEDARAIFAYEPRHVQEEALSLAASALGCETESFLSLEAIVEEHQDHAQFLDAFICNADEFIRTSGQQRIIIEGAQALMLSLKHGSHPFTTSCDCSLQGVAAAAGIHEDEIDYAINVVKAYATRVGGGPFPTELPEDEAPRLRELGGEYGTTTKRPRRVGWLDYPQLRYLANVNNRKRRNEHILALMKLDVLSTYDRLPVATHYTYDGPWHRSRNGWIERGHKLSVLDPDAPVLANSIPSYQVFDGWGTDITGCRSIEDLPKQALQYLKALEAATDFQYCMISVGPDREQTITH